MDTHLAFFDSTTYNRLTCMKHSIVQSVICFFSCITLFSCANPAGSSYSADSDTRSVAKIDIADAQMLFISSGTSTGSEGRSAQTSQTPVLYKLTTSGEVAPVSFLDSSDNAVSPAGTPVTVYNVNKTYIIVCMGKNSGTVYLVRKTDGSVNTLTAAPDAIQNGFINGRIIQTDASGSLYFIHSDSAALPARLYKTVTSSTRLMTIPVTPESVSVKGFTAAPDGTVMYHTAEHTYILKANGTGETLSETCTAYWTAPDGSIYYQTAGADDKANIMRLTIQQDYTSSFTAADTSIAEQITMESAWLLPLADKLAIASVPDAQDHINLHTVYSTAETASAAISLPLQHVTAAASSGTYCYFAAKDKNDTSVAVRVNADNGQYDNVLPPGAYDVLSLTSADDGSITFRAKRINGGTYVLGTVSATGTLTILKEDTSLPDAALLQL